jgi:hypothetical protein
MIKKPLFNQLADPCLEYYFFYPNLVMKSLRDDKLVVYQSKEDSKETIVIRCLDSKNAIFPYVWGDYKPILLPFISMDSDPNFLAASLPQFPKNMLEKRGMIFKLMTE